MFFLRVALSLTAALCATAAQSAWEETTVIPVQLQAPGTSEEASGKLFYRLDIFGKRMVLEVVPDQTFLAPGFVFHVVGKPEGRRRFDSSAEARCFYTGTVNRDKSSAVALNVCHGLRGGFSYGGEEYFIQPENVTGESGLSSRDMHTIRRRNRQVQGEAGGSKCGVSEDEEKITEHHETKPVSTPNESQGRCKNFPTSNIASTDIMNLHLSNQCQS